MFSGFAGLFLRLGVLLSWLARPARFTAASNGSSLWPLLGAGSLGWLLALLIDVGGSDGAGYANRGRWARRRA